MTFLEKREILRTDIFTKHALSRPQIVRRDMRSETLRNNWGSVSNHFISGQYVELASGIGTAGITAGPTSPNSRLPVARNSHPLDVTGYAYGDRETEESHDPR